MSIRPQIREITAAIEYAIYNGADDAEDSWGHPAARGAVELTGRAGWNWEFVSWQDTLINLELYGPHVFVAGW